MLESTMLAFAAFVLLAATAHRNRRDSGLMRNRSIRAARVLATILFVGALALVGEDVTGERVVRFLGVVSVAGVMLVLVLSFRPATIWQPWRAMLKLADRTAR